MVKATDWATTDVLDKYMATVPTTKEFSKAILELSVKLDPALVKSAVQAHKKAVDAMGPDFVTPLRNHEEVTVALAKMFAAAPADKIKAVFDATPGVEDLNAAWYAQRPRWPRWQLHLWMGLSARPRRGWQMPATHLSRALTGPTPGCWTATWRRPRPPKSPSLHCSTLGWPWTRR